MTPQTLASASKTHGPVIPAASPSLAAPVNRNVVTRSNSFRFVHLVSFGGLSGFVVAVLALHGLRGSLNPVDHTISDYSLGRYGWLMRAAFAALGSGVLGTAVSLHLTSPPTWWRRVGLMLLTFTAVGLFLDSGYNTDYPGVAETFDGAMHGVGMLIICLTLPTASFILGCVFLQDPSATRQARWLQVLGIGQLIAIVGFKMSPTTSRGLTERVAVALALAALFMLRSLAHTPGTRGVEAWPSEVRGWRGSTWAIHRIGGVLVRVRRTRSAGCCSLIDHPQSGSSDLLVGGRRLQASNRILSRATPHGLRWPRRQQRPGV
jgi:hypothetical protein